MIWEPGPLSAGEAGNRNVAGQNVVPITAFITGLSSDGPGKPLAHILWPRNESLLVVFSYRLISCTGFLMYENGAQRLSCRRHQWRPPPPLPSLPPPAEKKTRNQSGAPLGLVVVVIPLFPYLIRKSKVGTRSPSSI